MQIKNNAYDYGKQGSARRGQPHRKQGAGAIRRGKVRPRNPDQDDRENIVQKRDSRLPVRAEIPAEAKVNACEHAVPYIPAQILAARQNDRHILFFGKDADHRLRPELRGDRRRDAEPRRDANGVSQHGARPLMLPRPDILRGQCGNRREHGGRHEEQRPDYFFHDPDCGGVMDSPAVRNDGNDQKSDLDQAVLQSHRDSDF